MTDEELTKIIDDMKGRKPLPKHIEDYIKEVMATWNWS